MSETKISNCSIIVFDHETRCNDDDVYCRYLNCHRSPAQCVHFDSEELEMDGFSIYFLKCDKCKILFKHR